MDIFAYLAVWVTLGLGCNEVIFVLFVFHNAFRLVLSLYFIKSLCCLCFILLSVWCYLCVICVSYYFLFGVIFVFHNAFRLVLSLCCLCFIMLSVWCYLCLSDRAASSLVARGSPCRLPRTMDTRYYTLPTGGSALKD